VIFFLFTSITALLLQTVILPFFFSGLHAGNGLLLGNDSTGFHQIAVKLSQQIKSDGWAVWELRPYSHPMAGIAAAIYAITTPEPYALIPINAALHATSGLVLMRLAYFLTKSYRTAFLSAIPFVFYPSAMAWYAQIQKDGFFFTGIFLCLYGWVLLSRLKTWESGFIEVIKGCLWIGSGLFLIAIVRIYGLQLMQGIGVILAIVLSLIYIIRGTKGLLSWKKCSLAIIVLFIIPVVISFGPKEKRTYYSLPTKQEVLVDITSAEKNVILFAKSEWKKSDWMPEFIENNFFRISVLRQGYLLGSVYENAGSTVDREIRLLSVPEFIVYLPRALQLGFLSPFPADWVSQAYSLGGNIMRLVAGAEMSGVYLALLFLPYVFWRWRGRVELWVITAFAMHLLLVCTFATPNIGSLYRLRFGYLMLVVTLGLTGATTIIFELLKSKKSADTLRKPEYVSH
jgi:hypothetical protein